MILHERRAPAGFALPAIAAAACVCLSLLAYASIRAQQRDLLRKSVQVEALRARADQRADVLAAAQALDRLARRWERRRSFTHEELGFEASLEVTTGDHLDAIEWIDPSRVVRWAVPARWHDAVRGRDLSGDPVRVAALDQARASGQAASTGAVDLAPGGRGLLVVRPVKTSAGLVGFLGGVVAFRSLVEATLDEKFSERYALTLLEAGRPVYTPPPEARVDPDLGHEVALSVLGRTWLLRVTPTAATLAESRTRLAEWTLAAGAIFSLMFAAVLQLARTSRVRAAAMETLYAQLVESSSRREQLEAERERFFALSTDVLCVAGCDGVIRHINPAGESLLGLTANHASRLCDLASPADGDPIARASTAARGSGPVAFEGRMRTVGGEERWLQWRLTVVPDEGLCFGVARDVTERKRSEALLARHVDELARSNAELEQFAYVASHDLKEPLRMVSLYADLIASDLTDRIDDRYRRYLGYVIEGASRMESLVEDLLALARLHGRHEPLPIGTARVLSRAVRNVSAGLDESRGRVDHGPLPEVMGHEPALVQLFQNLIANAVKFRSAAPLVISVSAERSAGSWTFAVTDNGIGIDPRHHARIFQVFERLHARTRFPGNGIGLALCRKIVQLHGGRIWVESREGCGATFRFTLPAVAGVAA